jgi:hypothetical protein
LFDPASFFKSNGEEETKDAGGEAKASDGASVTATTGDQEHVLVTLPSRESHQSLDDLLWMSKTSRDHVYCVFSGSKAVALCLAVACCVFFTNMPTCLNKQLMTAQP